MRNAVCLKAGGSPPLNISSHAYAGHASGQSRLIHFNGIIAVTARRNHVRLMRDDRQTACTQAHCRFGYDQFAYRHIAARRRAFSNIFSMAGFRSSSENPVVLRARFNPQRGSPASAHLGALVFGVRFGCNRDTGYGYFLRQYGDRRCAQSPAVLASHLTAVKRLSRT